MEETRALMRLRRKLRPGDDNNFYLVTSEVLLNLWKGISQRIFTSPSAPETSWGAYGATRPSLE